jgi:hypothetical protein
MLRSAPLFAAWCAAEPGSYQTPASVTVPALRSGMKNAAPRPGHEEAPCFYSTLPIFFTAAIRRALSASTNFANSGASI